MTEGQGREGRPAERMASSRRRVPTPETSAVYSGISKDTCTHSTVSTSEPAASELGAGLHVGLCREVVDLVRFDPPHHIHQVGGVGEVAVVQEEARLALRAPGQLVVGSAEEVLQGAGVSRSSTVLQCAVSGVVR